jgi:NAD-dependent SIR2 family protein deacetylase
MKHLKLEFSQMSNPKWFENDPNFAWGFWMHRYELYSNSIPHEGYNILKEFSKRVDEKDCIFFIIKRFYIYLKR